MFPDAELHQLGAVLTHARRVHRATLRGRHDPILEMTTRADVLLALEDVIEALEVHHLPVPRRMQQEITILRNMARYPGSKRNRNPSA
jgi:hypothetical protein